MSDQKEPMLTPRERAFLEQNPDVSMRTENERAQLVGVTGWLGLLVASLLVIYPIFAPLKTWLEIADTAEMYPEVVQQAVWQSLVSLSWVMAGVSAAISFHAGWRLSFRGVPSSVTIAIASLWLIGPVRVLIELVLVSSITGTSVGSSADFVDVIRSLIVTAIWTAYLLRSKRVRNTYGS